MSGKKSNARRTPRAPLSPAAHSDIIRHATIYVQSMAAYQAGFKADATGNFAYAGAKGSQPGGRQLHKADKSLRKLVAISPACMAGRAPLTREELYAKAAVLTVVTQQMEVFSEPNRFERVFISLFAQETTDYLASLDKTDGMIGAVQS
jgi:hypothetical protein